MSIRDLQFRFLWLPTLLAMTVPVFIGLGLWQLDRADQKRALAATLAERVEAPPRSLPASRIADPEALHWLRLRAKGTWETEEQVLIEGRRHAGRLGFHVITPLRQQGSDLRVLVNRGWVAAPADGSVPRVTAAEGLVEVSGLADIPSPPALVLHDENAAGTWGNRWPYLTLALFEARVDYPLQGLVILQDPVAGEPLVRQWRLPEPKVWMHQGYAIQWFAFALIALVIYLRLSFTRRRPPMESP